MEAGMIISLTSPSNGLGQSITAINLTAALSVLLNNRENKTLIIDANYNSKDIEYYLSDGKLTKGIDDFVSLYRCNLLSMDKFNSCVKNIHKNIDIMASGINQDFLPQYTEILIEYAKKLYNTTVIDTVSLGDNLSKAFFKVSDFIVVVISQTKQSVKQFIQKFYSLRNTGKKFIIIINKYIDKEIIYGTVASDPYKMGYESIKALVDVKNGDSIPTFIDTEVKVITKRTLSSIQKPE
jgi:cellulose biosynthesis protein BcsQ